MKRVLWVFVPLLLTGLTGWTQELPPAEEDNSRRSCLVLVNGERLLLAGEPVQEGGSARFVLAGGQGPYLVKENLVDWAATRAGCLVRGDEVVAAAPPIPKEAPLVTTDTVENLRRDKGGHLSVMEHASTPSGMLPTFDPPRQRAYPVDRPPWEARARTLKKEKKRLEKRLKTLLDREERLERDLAWSYGHHPYAAAHTLTRIEEVRDDMEQVREELKVLEQRHQELREQAAAAGVPQEWVD